jgi:hypothetical protein
MRIFYENNRIKREGDENTTFFRNIPFYRGGEIIRVGVALTPMGRKADSVRFAEVEAGQIESLSRRIFVAHRNNGYSRNLCVVPAHTCGHGAEILFELLDPEGEVPPQVDPQETATEADERYWLGRMPENYAQVSFTRSQPWERFFVLHNAAPGDKFPLTYA